MDLNTVEDLIPATGRNAVDAFRPGDAWLAGGSALFAEPNPHLRRLIDLHALGWEPVAVTDAGLEIAATCTIRELVDFCESPAVPEAWRPLVPRVVRACAEALRGSFKVWNVGSVGGNLCTALPAGPMTSLTAGLDGRCLIWQPGGRERLAAVPSVVVGDGVNALAPGELLRSILLPAEVLRGVAAVRQGSLTTMGRSAALLVARRPAAADGDGFHLTITASVDRAVDLDFPDGVPSAVELDDAIEARLGPGDYFDDLHGTPAWRRHLTRALARGLRDELEQAAR